MSGLDHSDSAEFGRMKSLRMAGFWQAGGVLISPGTDGLKADVRHARSRKLSDAWLPQVFQSPDCDANRARSDKEFRLKPIGPVDRLNLADVVVDTPERVNQWGSHLCVRFCEDYRPIPRRFDLPYACRLARWVSVVL